jgi:DNA recombination protein RmuC
VSEKVVLAKPASLFCLLNAVSYGWRQTQLTENAHQISQLGREIHDRIADWAVHLDKLGEYLEKAVESFNKSLGSLEHRVLVSARRFREFGILSDKEIPESPPIDTTVRESPKIEGPRGPREQP